MRYSTPFLFTKKAQFHSFLLGILKENRKELWAPQRFSFYLRTGRGRFKNWLHFFLSVSLKDLTFPPHTHTLFPPFWQAALAGTLSPAKIDNKTVKRQDAKRQEHQRPVPHPPPPHEHDLHRKTLKRRRGDSCPEMNSSYVKTACDASRPLKLNIFQWGAF